jgi:hypothetical protein
MKRKGTILVILAMLAQPALAFENKCTHPLLTGNGILLVSSNTSANYGELLYYLSDAETGSDKEDEEGHLPFLNHFYDPATLQPLNTPGLGPLASQYLETAPARAHRYWQQAITSYGAGKRDLFAIKCSRRTAAHHTMNGRQPNS